MGSPREGNPRDLSLVSEFQTPPVGPPTAAAGTFINLVTATHPTWCLTGKPHATPMLPKALAVTESEKQPASTSGSWHVLGLLLSFPWVGTRGSRPQYGAAKPLPHVPSLREAATKCGSPCTSNTHLHWSPSREAPEPTHLALGLRLHHNVTQSAPQGAHLTGDLNRHRTRQGQVLLPGLLPCTAARYTVIWVNPHSWPA